MILIFLVETTKLNCSTICRVWKSTIKRDHFQWSQLSTKDKVAKDLIWRKKIRGIFSHCCTKVDFTRFFQKSCEILWYKIMRVKFSNFQLGKSSIRFCRVGIGNVMVYEKDSVRSVSSHINIFQARDMFVLFHIFCCFHFAKTLILRNFFTRKI